MADRTIANDSGSTRSTWMDETVPRYDDPVPGEARPDACVIGGGIAGLTVALALVQAGADVLVLDQGAIGGGQTARTSAHLASAIDDRYSVVERRFGKRSARLVAESHSAAIDAIEANARAYAPDCDFRRVDGYLFVPPDESRRILERELEAAQRAGLACEQVERAPLPFDTGACLRFSDQAEFHPLAYVRGLAKAILAGGGTIRTGVHVASIHGGTPVIVELANGRRLRCGIAIDATNTTISSRLDIPTREAAYRTYIVALAIERGYVPHALYWDTADPYHYVRVARGENGGEILIVGGEDHRVGHGDPAVHWPHLEAWARERFPLAGAVVARWSGGILEPADGLAYIGKHPAEQHVYLVTGDSGNGLTHGTIAGLLLPTLIAGRTHPWQKLYAPDRTRVHALGTLAAEAARSNAPYADWLRPGDVESLDAIAPGHGATIRRGLHVLAAYRDLDGQCHLRNARCPHLSGVVRWNAVERTWDCPCHGSRFDPYGRVLNGPAPEDLHDPPEHIEHPTPLPEPTIGEEIES
jgi:glycine/D-amino acid oxidase-like deaminating enzyme/nitrite reductase/ring-hydroxylating ferredoxin subunit